MQKYRWMLLVFVVLFAASITMLGCSKVTNVKVEAPAKEAPAEEAAAEAPAEEAPAEAGGEYTFDALCDKLIEEMKTTGTPDSALTQTKEGCEAASKAYEGQNEALEAFVKHIMTTCEGKSGMDWFTCYSNEGAAAGAAAAAAMKH